MKIPTPPPGIIRSNWLPATSLPVLVTLTIICLPWINRDPMSFVGILTGHGIMMLGGWSWYFQGYPGVDETVLLLS